MLINEIIIEKGRSINHEKVRELAGSIAEVGLINPISVDNDGKLIAGLHRVEACKLLGWKDVPVTILGNLDAKRRRLAQLDENLVRNEGTVLERAEWLKERKEIYEELHPETRQYVSGGKGKEKAKNTSVKMTFVDDTSKKTGKSERTIQRDIQIANKLVEDVKEMIAETELADRKTDLLKLSRMDGEEQKAVAEKIVSGEAGNVKDAKKIIKREKYTAQSKDVAIATETYRLMCGDFAEVSKQIEDESVDAIITDPPYPKEYLPLFGLLSKEAARILKPGGSLLVMVGQSYLPDALDLLRKHLNYHWTIAYMTPGGQAPMIRHRNVNAFWKPVFWFVKGKYEGDWRSDVVVSNVNDNDKRFHDWGQSESGIGKLVADYTLPGELVLDPFVGGGTTAIACIKLGRRFIGIDIDQEQIDITLGRLKEEG